MVKKYFKFGWAKKISNLGQKI